MSKTIEKPCRLALALYNSSHQADVAQLVEHIIRNDGVAGSNPVIGTNCKN